MSGACVYYFRGSRQNCKKQWRFKGGTVTSKTPTFLNRPMKFKI